MRFAQALRQDQIRANQLQDPDYPYLLLNLKAGHANHIWGIDITTIRLTRGWLYLTAVLDWHSRIS